LVLEVDGAPESIAFTVNDDIPMFVGVPAIAPVGAVSDRPASGAPDWMLHVQVPEPPVAASDLL
jgi:hypothetical protein